MSLLNKIKYAFGLDTSNDLEDDVDFNDLPDASVPEHKSTAQNVPTPVAEPNDTDKSEADGADTTITASSVDVPLDAIFEHVVSTFNIALPDFLRKSVNPESQRKYLYNTLSSDLQHFLKGVAANAEGKYRKIWHDEREKLNAKLSEAERLAAEYSRKNNDLRQNLLSADRQKRALSTRSAELEKKIYELEASLEQRDLESKSMVSKVKAAQVYEQDIEAMRSEIAELTKQLEEARKSPAAQAKPEPAKQRPEDAKTIADLRTQLEEASLKIAELSKPKPEPAVKIKLEADKTRQPAQSTQNQKDQPAQKPKNNPKEEKQNERPERRPHTPQSHAERIDDILGDTEWIVTPSPSKRKRDNDNHNPNNDDNRQMSLF